MIKIITTFINLISRHKFYCECGYKTNKHAAMIDHIGTHPSMAGFNIETGAPVWE